MGSTEVFNFNSVELKVSVMVFKAGVAAVDEDKTTAGNVSILEDRSKSAVEKSEEVKIFSGAGMVSVWNNGLDADGAIVGLNVLVNVLEKRKLFLKNVTLEKNFFSNNSKSEWYVSHIDGPKLTKMLQAKNNFIWNKYLAWFNF